MKDTFADWEKYLKWLERENYKISLINKRLEKENEKERQQYAEDARAHNKRLKIAYENQLKKRREELDSYAKLPWWKQVFAEPPSIFPPISPYYRSEISMTFPLYHRLKQPSVEEYLTWRLEK